MKRADARSGTWLALALAVCGAVAGCSDAPIQPRTRSDPNDPLVQRIVRMGFRGDMIKDMGTYFLVEGDIVLRKDDLKRRQRSSPLPRGLRPDFQWHTYNLVGASRISNIRVAISAALEAGWAQATRDALVQWSSISGTIITFVENEGADITVSPSSTLGDSTVAMASFPVGFESGPGGTIDVNTRFNYYSSSQKLFVMVHEFGHTIGFRHTNWQGLENADPYGALKIGITPDTDSNSIMNGGTGSRFWSGFSYWDVEAARVLYAVLPTVTVTDQGVGRPYLVSWTTVPGAIR